MELFELLTKGKKIALVTLIVVLIPITYVSIERAYDAGPLAPYICPPFSYNTSKFSECRVFTQTGHAIIQTDWTGNVLSDLYLKGAPVGSYALWLRVSPNASSPDVTTPSILIKFPNGSTLICNDGLGPCSIGIV